MTKITALG